MKTLGSIPSINSPWESMSNNQSERPFWWRANVLACADYIVGVLLLTGLASIGLVTWDVVLNIALIAVSFNFLIYGSVILGLTSGLRDPMISGLQVLAGCAINMVGILMAPQLVFYFVINLFVPLSFGRFHFPRKTFLGAWILIVVSLGLVMFAVSDRIRVELTSPKDRLVFWFVCSLAFARFLVIHSEVSRMRAKLRESNSRLRASREYIARVVSELPAPVMVFDKKGNAALVNQAAAREMREFGHGLVPNQLGPILEKLQPVLGGSIRNFPIHNQEVEAPNEKRFLLGASVLTDSQDKGLDGETVLSLWDITPLRLAEKQRETTLNFLSHDLRAPLSALLATLNNPEVDLEQSRQGLSRSVRSCLSLADDFVLIARTTRTDPAQLRELDLQEVISDAICAMEPLAKVREVRLRWEQMDADVPVAGDWSLLRRAMVNLLDNAQRYSPERGEVYVSLSGQGNDWVVMIEDDGPGFEMLPPYTSPQLAKLNTLADAVAPTAGLGLKLVSLVTSLHGGEFVFENRPTGGARVKIYLPKLLRVKSPGQEPQPRQGWGLDRGGTG
jgi:signal transduction histidine kinase